MYGTHAAYAIDAFDLTVQARAALEAIERITGRPEEHVYLRGEEIEQARAIGAAHGENWQTIIVGHDVASQLISDQLVRRLKEYRARLRRERELESRRTDHQTAAAAADDVRASGVSLAKMTRRRDGLSEKRIAGRVERAVALNLELGRTTYTELSRVKVDERAVKILSSIDVTGKLSEIAMRGARYGFPGWVTGFDPAMLGPVPGHVHVEAWMDEVRVLADADLVVCHGGAGTALGALAAGVPLVIVPLFADQFENAWRIAATGAGIVVQDAPLGVRRPIDVSAAPCVARAIETVLGDASFRRRARAIAAEMAAAPTQQSSVACRAVRLSRRHLAGHRDGNADLGRGRRGSSSGDWDTRCP